MASMTGGEVVERTQQLLQTFGDIETFRPGWSDDTSTEGTPIRESLNEFLALLQPTGIRTGDQTFATVIGQAYYDLLLTTGEIYYVAYGTTLLRQATMQAEVEDNRTLLSAPSATPERFIREGYRIRLVPTPAAVATVTIHGTLPLQTFSDAQKATALLYIPEYLQRFVPHGLAAYMAVVDAENQAHATRFAHYLRNAYYLVQELIRISRAPDLSKRTSLNRYNPQQQVDFDTQAQVDSAFRSIYGNILAPTGVQTQ